MLFGPHFDPYQCKVQLKLAVSRIQIQKTKKANLVRDEKRHIAELLRNHNEESARIRVETVIRDESLIECFNIIEVLCELVFARLSLISSSDQIPSELKESIYTLVYASQRVQIPELELIKKQLCAKYGKGLESEVNCHCSTHVNPKIVHKLSYVTPEPFLIFQHLNDIACQFRVDWSVDPIVSPISPTFVPPPQPVFAVPVGAQIQPPQPQMQMQMPMSMPMNQPPPMMHNLNSPPPFPTNLIAPQQYSMPPPPYTSSANSHQFPQPPPIVNRTTSQPQFPSAPQFNSSNLSFSASASAPPPNSNHHTPQFPSAPTSNLNSDPYPDFDELTARFDALKKQNEDYK